MAEIDVLAARSAATGPEGAPSVSVVVPIYDEEQSVDELYVRTVGALEGEGRSFELIFVDDGSSDGTFARLERLHDADPRVRVVRFKRNFGQHPAMHAGLARARGEILVTMDGDLQNAPEDIGKLVAAVEAGADVASGRRASRHDSWGRTLPSKLINGTPCWAKKGRARPTCSGPRRCGSWTRWTAPATTRAACRTSRWW
jgi:dolichol-phosphate mannosyltransferase